MVETDFLNKILVYIYQHRGEYFIFVLQVLMFSTQPGEFPGVAPRPGGLGYSYSLVRLERGT